MAIKFEKIKEGMTLYDVRKATGLQKFNSKFSIWPVHVKEVDSENRRVLASWNNNKNEWMSEQLITKYRAKKPKGV